MTKPIFILGLPGSGKTTLAKSLNDTLQKVLWAPDPIDFDKFKQNCISSVYFDYFIVDSAYLCEQDAQELLLTGLKNLNPKVLDPLWICFDNNIEACLQNVKCRGDLVNVLDDIHYYSDNYSYPENCCRVPVYSSMHKNLVIDHILDELNFSFKD